MARVEVLAPVAGVRAVLANARAVGASAMMPTIDAVASIVVLALIACVRATLTDAHDMPIWVHIAASMQSAVKRGTARRGVGSL